MPNSNCLKGMQCPKCGWNSPLDIDLLVPVRVYDSGTEWPDHHFDIEWDDGCNCHCVGCGHVGLVKDFELGREDEDKAD